MASEHFDAVVVGSGFGGSVTSYRLAEAGLDVCVLERGKAYPPGSFPRAPHKMKENFWDPEKGLYGMFDLWSFEHFEALVSSGLGGGSLIYANVLLRKDPEWFVREDLEDDGHAPWPVSREDLDPHYDRVEDMMNAQRYPADAEPYRSTPKTNAFQEAAQELDLDWERPPLAVTFHNDGDAPVPGAPIDEPAGNLHGRPRQTCRLCGECDIGCNYGSKNTLDYNYLSAAEREGADLRTLHEVRSFRPLDDGSGYEIFYVEHDPNRPDPTPDDRHHYGDRMTADRLILSAGTLGSTKLMLENREHLTDVSPALGSRFCGNGDLLGFAVDAEEPDPVNGGTRARELNPNEGPVITSTIRVGDILDENGDGSSGRGFYLQDAGYPSFLSWIAETGDFASGLTRLLRFGRQLFSARTHGDTNLSDELETLLGGEFSKSTMPLLGMGRDVPNGQMSLDDQGRLHNDWRQRASHDYFERLKQTMENVAHAMGADFLINPTWFWKRVITVHALGGNPMGRTQERGVVNEYGEVYNNPGLYVADGSIMPGPVGPNPSLTIAALADRIADRILHDSDDASAPGTDEMSAAGASENGEAPPEPHTEDPEASDVDAAGSEDANTSDGNLTSESDVPPRRPSEMSLREEVVSFTAEDGYKCNLLHLRGEEPPTKGPVIVVHGAGVRANIFRAPVEIDFAEYLVREGYDVWLENWRASIDLQPNEWTIDRAARYDHPAAVETVIDETGADSVQAVIHCQGSTSFALSAVAGLLPQVRTIVSNAVSLHTVVPEWSDFKIKYVVPAVGRLTRYLNPQWNDDTDGLVGRALYGLTELTHHECDNPVCKQVSFYYGSGFPALWSHENLNDRTHDEWLRHEFANVPISFYDQMKDCVEAGHLVGTGEIKDLPADVTAQPPETDARFALFAGKNNQCFLPESQVHTYEFLDRHRPGRDSLHLVPDYGHLDMFMGKHAYRDVYPKMIEELDRDN